jgi:hypothetical protein
MFDLVEQWNESERLPSDWAWLRYADKDPTRKALRIFQSERPKYFFVPRQTEPSRFVFVC